MLKKLPHTRSARYLIAGAWNTTFGYGIGIALYFLLADYLHITLIGIICNLISITMSFTIYKLFVFETQGNWLHEYVKSYLVYGAMAVLSVLLLWIFVDFGRMNIWLAQALTILLTVAISYLGHKTFTFKMPN